MQTANKLMMISLNVAAMAESKSFYVDKLGFTISTEYRQDDDNWWTTLAFPEGGVTLTLARASMAPESVKEGTISLYFESNDVEAAHKELSSKGLKLDDVKDDLFGPGSGVKWLSIKDPDGNDVYFAQKHAARSPF